MSSLERLQTTAETTSRLIEGFWIRRIFRIYPLACLFIVMVAVLHIPELPGSAYTWIGVKAFWANFFLVQNLTGSPNIMGVLWSLPLEVQMYVLLPFLFLVVRGEARYRSLLLWLLSVLVALAAPHINWRLGVFSYGPCFVGGIVAYDLLRSKVGQRRLPSWVWPLTILAAMVIFWPHDNVSLDKKFYRAWFVCLGVGVMYTQIADASANFLQPMFHWIAEHSYGIYLSHTVLMWVALSFLPGPFALRMVFLAVSSVIVPAVLYRAVEHPLVLVGGHVARRLLHPHVEKAARV